MRGAGRGNSAGLVADGRAEDSKVEHREGQEQDNFAFVVGSKAELETLVEHREDQEQDNFAEGSKVGLGQLQVVV